MPFPEEYKVLSIEQMISKFTLGHNGDPALNRADIMALFNHDVSSEKSTARKLLNIGINQPDRFLRSSDERKAAAQLSQQMQNIYADITLSYALIAENYKKNPEFSDGITLLGRSSSFLNVDDTQQAKDFNDKLVKAAANYKTDPEPIRKLLTDEVDRMLNELNIKTDEDVLKIYDLSDAELVPKFSALYRMVSALTDLSDGDATKFFTKEQAAAFKAKYSNIIALKGVLELRTDLIANPLYAEYDANRLFMANIDSEPLAEASKPLISVTMDFDANLSEEEKESQIDNLKSSMSPRLHMPYFTKRLFDLAGFSANTYPERLGLINPNLKGVFDNKSSGDLTYALQQSKSYVVVGNDGKEYVLTRQIKLENPPTAEAYGDDLLARAIKADKWLLTGSKQFADMIDAAKRLKIAENEEPRSLTDVEALTKQLKNAAQKYLKYKDSDFTEYTGPSSVRGKNTREQTRLEVAGELLNFATAREPAFKPLKEYNKAQREKEATEKVVAAPKQERITHTLEKKEVDVISAKGKQDFMNDLSYNINKVVGREVPGMRMPTKDKEGKDIIVSKTVMSQEEFNSLCAMIAGSPKAFYRRPKKVADAELENQSRKNAQKQPESDTFMNDNAEKTHQDMMTAISGSYELDQLPKDLRFMLTGAMSIGKHAVQNGNFENLGPMLADGLKLNNAVMQQQKQFTPEFYLCAKMTADVLNIMEKPELKGLKDVILANMGKKDLEIANACRGVYNVIADGIKAQNKLETRFRMKDESIGFSKQAISANDKGILDDMAKFCHMYGMEMQFATGNLKLDNCNYAKFPTFANTLNAQLAGTQNINDFVDKVQAMPAQQRANAIRNPQEMANLFQNGMNAIGAMAQQNQPSRPTVELKLQAAQAQAAQPPQSQQQIPS